jgi:hypothetical protein
MISSRPDLVRAWELTHDGTGVGTLGTFLSDRYTACSWNVFSLRLMPSKMNSRMPSQTISASHSVSQIHESRGRPNGGLEIIFAQERPLGADSLRQCSVRNDPLTFGLVLWP